MSHTGIMFAQLRSATTFFLLTIVIVGWLSAWTVVRSVGDYGRWAEGFSSGVNIRSHRPFYSLARRLRFIHGNTTFASTVSDIRIVWVAIQTPAGIRVINTDVLEEVLSSETILKAGYVEYRTQIDEFGLLAPVAIKREHSVVVNPFAGFPKLGLSETCEAFTAHTPEVFGPFDQRVRTRWVVSHRAVVHDLLFLLTFIAWLISLTGIPRWIIWKRLTPGQCRRAKH